MKILIWLYIVLLPILASASPSVEDTFWLAPEPVKMVPDEIFISSKYDVRDPIRFVISGSFPNSCFKIGPVATQVDSESRTIVVRNQAYYYRSCWCLFYLVPYVRSVEIGVLGAGSYQVLAEDEEGLPHLMGILNVEDGNTKAS